MVKASWCWLIQETDPSASVFKSASSHHLIMKLLAVCVLVFSVMAQTRADPIPDDGSPDPEEVDLVQRSTCPPGWSPINNRCFHYVAKPMTWARAERNCLSMGANLASVHDTNEYHQVQSVIEMATYKSDETWIGGTNAQETSIWFWSDGSPLRYTNWCHGEPNNWRNNQHCLQMNYSGEKCWDDQTCSVRLPSVCAKEV
ncbi:type-2 ice-structuring protein isoform X1 [Fundulus heteroclitus]|uniref:type-2 ice-structuring protein isoform X1 n=1 Tax=Fundulus heteroclitus TaxID=8078 RepID=UPI00165C2341|nr:type-2 ice-structuring protein isoform X1 [Fundulus heteroclitus]